MKRYEPSQIRNIAIVGHGHSGKTMLCEALLFLAGETTRMGRVEDGTTRSDFEPEEQAHKISVSLSVIPVEFNGHKLNLIDTPGYADFYGDLCAALSVADACVFVVSATDGVQAQTEIIFDRAQDLGLPCVFVINKLDRENASFDQTLTQLKDMFGSRMFAMQLPIGAETDFKGVVDLLSNTATIYDGKDPSGKGAEVPPEMSDEFTAHHKEVVEAAAEGDDSLMEKYFDAGDLDPAEVAAGLHKAVKAGSVYPVFAVSATHLIGIDRLALDLCEILPSPIEREEITAGGVTRKTDPKAPMSAYVFKTISDAFVGKISVFRVFSGEVHPDHEAHNPNQKAKERLHQLFYLSGKEHPPAPAVVCGDIAAVAKLAVTHTGDTLCDEPDINFDAPTLPEPQMSIAITSKARGEEEKVSLAMQRLIEEDPVLHVFRNSETHQTVVSGLGENHLNITFERMKRKFGVEIEQLPLRIPYRETLMGEASHASRYIKQSGGRGQYAVAHINVEALPHGTGYEFVNKIVGGAIPSNYIPSVDKGVQGAMTDGVLAGYPVVDVKVTVFDGKFHAVDSSDMAFQICASQGFKEAARKAGVGLLEPVMRVQIRVPEANLGDTMGDVNSRRGKILGTEPDSRGYQLVDAEIPMAEMMRFPIDLRSMTGGRATFTSTFDHYEHVPQHLQDKLVDQAKTEHASAK